MKKLAPLLVLILALLMQVRVAYACETSGFWPAEPCHAHPALIVDAHPDAPSDRGERCDVSLDLAVRAGRDGRDDGTLSGRLPADPPVAILPVSLAIAGPVVAATVSPPPSPRAPAIAAGTRTWLSTARLRL